nr:GR [Eucryptorrhynchus scrobiculatus]
MRRLIALSLGKKGKFPTKLLYKSNSSTNTFHDSMKKPLLLLQVFGFFPVGGIMSSNYKDLKFSWVSWRILYYLVFLIGNIINFVCYCVHRKIDKILVVNAVFFHLEGVLLSILFLNLAQQWPQFVKEWHLVEVSMKRYELSMKLKRKVALIITSILGLALIEHAMVTTQQVLLSINRYPNNTYDAMQDFFATVSLSEIFYYLPYYAWLGFYFKFLSLQKTFIWTFIDIFLISISLCFNFRLLQISKKLRYMSKIVVADEFVWGAIRRDYVKLSQLCELTNKRLCWFIIISYFSNIYHILVQLFGSLRPIQDPFHKNYFYVSFLLLILRVSAVCIFGGAIYEEHEDITRIVTTVPSTAYNIEVERFILHLATCEMGLTEKNFFKITRNLILKVTSVIVTYELVLIQFNQQEFRKKEF